MAASLRRPRRMRKGGDRDKKGREEARGREERRRREWDGYRLSVSPFVYLQMDRQTARLPLRLGRNLTLGESKVHLGISVGRRH